MGKTKKSKQQDGRDRNRVVVTVEHMTPEKVVEALETFVPVTCPPLVPMLAPLVAMLRSVDTAAATRHADELFAGHVRESVRDVTGIWVTVEQTDENDYTQVKVPDDMKVDGNEIMSAVFAAYCTWATIHCAGDAVRVLGSCGVDHPSEEFITSLQQVTDDPTVRDILSSLGR